MRRFFRLHACAGLIHAGMAMAQGGDIQLSGGPPASPDDCVTHAAVYHSVNPWILRAILKVESGFNPRAMNQNRNGTVDIGIAQINSMHLRELGKYGVGRHDLLDACKGTYVAAWHLRKQMQEHGNTWYAIGAYHSRTECFNTRYTGLVWNVLREWRVVNGPRVKVKSLADCGYHAPAQSKTAAKKGGDPSVSVLAFDN